MAKENKVKFGLSNVHYALLTTDSGDKSVYSEAVAIPGAVNLTAAPQGSTSNFYADNIAYYVTSANSGYQITLEVAKLPDKFVEDCLGIKVDAEDHVMTEYTTAEPKAFALMFQTEGNETPTYVCYYNCVATRPNDDAATIADAKTPATDSITITVSPLSNGLLKAKTTYEAEEKITKAWFTKPYFKAASEAA